MNSTSRRVVRALRRLAAAASHQDLARGITQVDARRLIANVDVDEDWLSRLLLVDLETGEEQLIDEQVKYGLFTAAWQLGERTYWYTVEDGERSGVWAVRLPLP